MPPDRETAISLTAVLDDEALQALTGTVTARLTDGLLGGDHIEDLQRFVVDHVKKIILDHITESTLRTLQGIYLDAVREMMDKELHQLRNLIENVENGLAKQFGLKPRLVRGEPGIPGLCIKTYYEKRSDAP